MASEILIAAGTSAADIQAAISAAAAGSTIRLGAGTFNFDQAVLVTRDNVKILGSGVGVTKIVLDADKTATAFRIRGGTGDFNKVLASDTVAGTTTSITLDSVAGIAVGSVIHIEQDNDRAWLDSQGNQHVAVEEPPLREMLAKVKSISGNTITFESPTPYSFAAGVAKVAVLRMEQNVELGGFSVTTDLPSADPYLFENTLTEVDGGAIEITRADGISVHDIAVTNSVSHGFVFNAVYGVKADSLSTIGTHNKGGDGNGYAFLLKTGFNNVFTNLYDKDMRHSFLTGSWSAEHYNQVHVTYTNRDINFHGSPDAGNTIVVDESHLDYTLDYSHPGVSPGNPGLHPNSTIDANDVTFLKFTGSYAKDVVHGNDAGSVLEGREDDDTLSGGKGVDVIDPGVGFDTMSGGIGSDRFILRRGDDRDVILDMQTGSGGDIVDLTGTGVMSMSELSIRQIGTDTVLSFGGDDSLTLKGVSKSNLTTANFRFATTSSVGFVIDAVGDDTGLTGGRANDVFSVYGGIFLDDKIDILGLAGTDILQLEDDTTVRTSMVNFKGVEIIDTSLVNNGSVLVDQAFVAQSDLGYAKIVYGSKNVSIGTEGITDWDKVRIEGTGVVSLRDEGAAISSAGGAIQVNGGIGADRIKGSAFADIIRGGAASDILQGMGGADEMYGGTANDIYYVDNAGDQVIETATDSGSDVVRTSVSYTLTAGSYIETLEMLDPNGTSGYSLGGNEFKNNIYGNNGNNTLDGGGDTDQLYGRNGNDIYIVDNFNDKLFEISGEGTDTVRTSATYTLATGQSIENLEVKDASSTNALTLKGNELANIMRGNSGANVMDGGLGNDKIYGYGGDDSYYVNAWGDKAYETSGNGYDTVFSTVNYALADDSSIELLRLLDRPATTALFLRGNGLANQLEGNAGNNDLDGGGGKDVLIGYGGDDLYRVDNWGDAVRETSSSHGYDTVRSKINWALTAGSYVEVVELDPSTGSQNLFLRGNEFANILKGNAGNNDLDGGAGDDSLYGFMGDDIYRVASWSDKVFEAAGEGNDRVITTVNYKLADGQSIENLEAKSKTDTADLSLSGNEIDNTLRGNAGKNSLEGGAGRDKMYGYAGDDVYNVDAWGDKVYESIGEGRDTVNTTVNYALQAGAEVEILQIKDKYSVDDLFLRGNEFANVLNGNNGKNSLDGGAGADEMYGFGGDDSYTVDNALDKVFEISNRGADTVTTSVSYALQAASSIEILKVASSNSQNLTLTGNELDNIIYGNAGSNQIAGGDGKDTLYGGLGNDTLTGGPVGGRDDDIFAFDTALGATNIDQITDFNVIDDMIWLDDKIFAGIGVPGALGGQFFTRDTQATTGDQHIIYDPTSGALFYDADGSGVGSKVQFASLSAGLNLQAVDFAIV